MAANTVLIRVDTVEKDVWDKILELAGESSSVSALTEAEEALLALADESEVLLSLAENADAILALLDDGGDTTPDDSGT